MDRRPWRRPQSETQLNQIQSNPSNHNISWSLKSFLPEIPHTVHLTVLDLLVSTFWERVQCQSLYIDYIEVSYKQSLKWYQNWSPLKLMILELTWHVMSLCFKTDNLLRPGNAIICPRQTEARRPAVSTSSNLLPEISSLIQHEQNPPTHYQLTPTLETLETASTSLPLIYLWWRWELWAALCCGGCTDGPGEQPGISIEATWVMLLGWRPSFC